MTHLNITVFEGFEFPNAAYATQLTKCLAARAAGGQWWHMRSGVGSWEVPMAHKELHGTYSH